MFVCLCFEQIPVTDGSKAFFVFQARGLSLHSRCEGYSPTVFQFLFGGGLTIEL